tara:strand:+ start:604 stop:1275 length:672 start_codon:yes stop_codon:yes gene_type:complete
MNFLNRLKFYLIGFSLGLFLIYTLFKDREWDWLPENKVKNFILKNPLKINLIKDQSIILNDQFAKKIFDLIINGNVNFSESKTNSINKKYIIEYNNSSALFNVSFEDTLCRLISIDNMIFKDHYEPEYLDTIVFIDRYNLLMKFDKMEKKFTKYFISKVKKYGLNSDDISKNLKNFKVDWKKSNPFSIINPKYIGTISISNLQYEISLETGNNKLRFKDFREN